MGFYEELKWNPEIGDFDNTNGRICKTTYIGSVGTCHGTHLASTILGYYYYSNYDAFSGYPLPPIIVRGIALDVTTIPVKVLADYEVPYKPDPGYPGYMIKKNNIWYIWDGSCWYRLFYRLKIE